MGEGRRRREWEGGVESGKGRRRRWGEGREKGWEKGGGGKSGKGGRGEWEREEEEMGGGNRGVGEEDSLLPRLHGYEAREER